MTPALQLQREPSVDGATLGKLYYRGTFICDVLEDEMREVAGVPVAEWKVHGKTAIPAGIYEVILQDSPRFGPECLTLVGVDGYKFIRIHAGNKSTDTEGCLLPGTRINKSTVGESRKALTTLRNWVVPELRLGKVMLIEINNPGMTA